MKNPFEKMFQPKDGKAEFQETQEKIESKKQELKEINKDSRNLFGRGREVQQNWERMEKGLAHIEKLQSKLDRLKDLDHEEALRMSEKYNDLKEVLGNAAKALEDFEKELNSRLPGQE